MADHGLPFKDGKDSKDSRNRKPYERTAVVTRDALERELGRGSWAGAFVKALAERFRDVDDRLEKLRSESR